jgi:hypothetical protein
MSDTITCADCQKALTRKGVLFALASQHARRQTEMFKEAGVNYEVLVEDDFETNALRVAIWGDTHALGTRIPWRVVIGDSDVAFLLRLDRAFNLLTAEVPQSPIGELQPIPYI